MSSDAIVKPSNRPAPQPGYRTALLVFALAVLGSHSAARGQSTADLLQQEEAAFQSAADAAAPCVVQIETFGGLERVGDELVADGPTTGTIVDSQGWIISTLYNFRQQPASILVTLPDGQRSAARVVARDYSRELALLKVDVPNELPAAVPADPQRIAVGSWTVALGKTYDKAVVSQSVGIISALGRAYGRAIQTDAKVSPINYGGPLIDLHGQVIGVLAPISPGTFFEGDSSELYDSGIGFAIPLEDILERLPRMQQGNDIQPGKLGVVSSDQNEFSGPVVLTGAAPGSPAAKAGVQAGDVLIEALGKPIHLLAELRHALAQVDAGQEFPFVIRRGGNRLELKCELAAEIPVYRRRYLGLQLAQDETGLKILGIEADSPAAQSDLHVGDQLLACNGQPIRSKLDLAKILAVAELDVPLELGLEDGNDQAKSVRILATTWPESLPEQVPAPRAGVDASAPVEILDVTLGDVPNQAFALVPPPADSPALGLLVLFPEPGAVDREKAKLVWQDFCRNQGWLVVVIASANPRAWSMEEVELASRVIGRMDQAYQLDKTRCVLGGLGIGGRLALLAATDQRQRVSGALTIGTSLDRFAIRRANAPSQSVDFLLVGEPPKLESVATQLKENGYAANVVPAGQLELQKWETLPIESISAWLAGLGRM